jgi:hypothetical protein
MRIKFVPTPVAAQPIIQDQKPQIPNDEAEEEEEFKQYEEKPKVQLNKATIAVKTGKVAPAKSNAFDQMEDIGEPVLADDPPLDEDEE